MGKLKLAKDVGCCVCVIHDDDDDDDDDDDGCNNSIMFSTQFATLPHPKNQMLGS